MSSSTALPPPLSGLSTLDPNAGPVQTLELRCEKDNSILTSITVHDCTNDNATSADTPDLQDDVMRASLAIVYLPAATLPVLSLHNAYLPVLVPVVPTSSDQASSVLRHAAEDDWELLGVPASRTVYLNSDKTPIMNADALSRLEPWKAFEVIRNVLDSPAQQIKPASENGHPARAVTLFALVSIMMGVAFNTAFHSPVPVGPTGTVRIPGNNTWGITNPLNRTLAMPVAGTGTALATSSSRDFSLSVLSPGITSLSVNAPQVNSLSITSRINSLSVSNSHPSSLSPIYTPTSLAEPGPSRLPISDAPQASSSKDVLLRPTASTSLSEVNPQPTVLSVTRTEKKRARADFTTPNALSLRFTNSLTEAMDIGAKIFTNAARLENGVKDLVDAMDDLMNSIQAQTQTVVTQSKGKARALGEEVISRNDRARGRAKELRKKGEELLNSASVQFFERKEIAKQRARLLKDTFKQTEAWKSYERVVQVDLAARLKENDQCAKDKPGSGGWLKRDSGWGSYKTGSRCIPSVQIPVH
ncbi:hypothetical protein NP233_g9654 [Leucocoprinus birnbaumii]|uniref:Uncharacterized protein n=1 Tax=Leucocoprinus birnbaumii TaxID=56174 RepID=A0AAD5YSN6_9AGAR|nr:hypothetical protein NP233_g9654 [Leucocoprinus birnbaumii]